MVCGGKGSKCTAFTVHISDCKLLAVVCFAQLVETGMDHLDRATTTCTVHSISAKTSKERIKCTQAKELTTVLMHILWLVWKVLCATSLIWFPSSYVRNFCFAKIMTVHAMEKGARYQRVSKGIDNKTARIFCLGPSNKLVSLIPNWHHPSHFDTVGLTYKLYLFYASIRSLTWLEWMALDNIF